VKAAGALLTGTLALGLIAVAADLAYLSRFKDRYQKIQSEKIQTSHQLATARIISENLPYVRDLVFHNMEFPGSQNENQAEAILLEFLSESIDVSGMTLVDFMPDKSTQGGARSTYRYRLKLSGSLDEVEAFARRMETHRRLISIVELEFIPGIDERARTKGRVEILLEAYRLRRQN
jgi:hypothetical protein